MKLLQKYWVLITFIIITLFYTSSYLLKDRIPFPSSFVANNISPWNAYLSGGPVKNGIPDVPGEIYPLRVLGVDFWKKGQVPLWNPYIFSGTPLAANLQSAVFFPLNILFWFLPNIHAFSILVLLQPLLAGVFMYFFTKSLGFSRPCSFLSGISFMFCGFLTVWGPYATLGYAFLFLPLVLFFVEKFWQSEQKKYLPLISIFLAASMLAGHIQTWVYVLLAAFLYSFGKFLQEKTKTRVFIWVAVFIFLSIPLSFIQIVPALELYGLSGRALVSNQVNIGIPFYYLITLIAPDFFGNPVTRNDWLGTYAEWSSYIGFVPLLFAIFGILKIKQHREIIPIVLVGLAGFVISVQNPILSFLSALPIPIMKNSNPARSIVLLSFALSVLAGWGMEFLKTKNEQQGKLFLKIVVAGTIFLCLLLLGIVLGGGFFPAETAKNLGLVSLRNLILPFMVLLTIWGGYFLTKRYLKDNKVFLWLLLLVSCFEMLRFYLKWMPFDEKKNFYPETKIISKMQQLNQDFSRFYGQMKQPAAMLGKVYSVEGYEPLNILAYDNLIAAAKTGMVNNQYRLSVDLESREIHTKRILDLLGVKYLLYNSQDARSGFVFPVWEYPQSDFPVLYSDEKFLLIGNKKSNQRAQLFSDYLVEDREEKALEYILKNNFPYQKKLVLSNVPPEIKIPKKLTSGSAQIIKDGGNEVEIKYKSTGDSIIMLADNYYPGWNAYINNKKIPVLKANYTFRAVLVPKGENMVIFRYEPRSFILGLLISLSTLVFLGLWGLFFLKTKNENRYI